MTFFLKLDQIRRKLRIWSHLLKKYIMENFIFCAVKTIFYEIKAGKSLSKVVFYRATVSHLILI